MQDEMKQWNEHVDAVAAKKFEDAWGVIPTTFHADNIIRRQEALLKQMAEALERLVFLHTCEQEGMSSGMPTFEDWIQAVNSAEQALAAYKGRGTAMTHPEYIAKLREALRQCDEAMAYMSEYDIPICLPDRVKEALALPVPEMTVDIEKGAIKIQTATLKIYSDDIAGVIDIDQCRKSAKAAAEAWGLKGK